jgi:predicted anti-sigma-YlaC factor YlaD
MSDSQNTLAAAATIDEELVAYLDGELDATGAARIERRLADDAAYRARLAQLQRAWDMLDTLQRSEANDDFARSTVEMIAIKAVDDAKTGQMRAVRQRSMAWAGIALAALLTAITGYFLLQWKLDQPNRDLVRDLPVIERLEQYRDADSVEFLQQLHQEGLFAAEVDDGI